jgi:uncharacterized phage protein (TIGR01671 family)
MKRPVKFKAKTKLTREWVEGYYVHFGDLEIKHGIYSDEKLWDSIDPNTLCQLTGEHDHNKQPLWEGDIIRHNYIDPQRMGHVGYVLGVIVYENASFRVREMGFNYESVGGTPELLSEWLTRPCYRVGSVHDERGAK